MAKPKNPKLAEFADLVAETQIPATKIAEISGATVEEVEAERNAAASNVIPDDEGDEDLSARERALARREAELAARERRLAAAERSDTRGRDVALTIRVKSVFDATTKHPVSGKLQSHRFVPSLYRGAMAVRICEIAEESGHTDLIEVLSEG